MIHNRRNASLPDDFCAFRPPKISQKRAKLAPAWPCLCRSASPEPITPSRVSLCLGIIARFQRLLYHIRSAEESRSGDLSLSLPYHSLLHHTHLSPNRRSNYPASNGLLPAISPPSPSMIPASSHHISQGFYTTNGSYCRLIHRRPPCHHHHRLRPLAVSTGNMATAKDWVG